MPLPIFIPRKTKEDIKLHVHVALDLFSFSPELAPLKILWMAHSLLSGDRLHHWPHPLMPCPQTMNDPNCVEKGGEEEEEEKRRHGNRGEGGREVGHAALC